MLPSWLKNLRRVEVTERVWTDCRTKPGTVLGVSPEDAKYGAAGWGQADFDQPWRHLSPADRVLLYAYHFQRGHLEELVEAFGQMFGAESRPEKPIVIDLGCGPFTGGLAIASCLPAAAELDYIGVDRSSAMRDFGERLASAVARVGELPRIRRRWVKDLPAVSWSEAPGWRPVIIIVSYLFASPTLDAATLVSELDDLLRKLGNGPATVLYTNSVRDEPNRQFPTFSAMLCAPERAFELRVSEKSEIDVDKGFGKRRLRYALFHRPQRQILPLADGK